MTSLSTTNTLHQFPSIQSTHQNAFPTFLNDTKSVEHLNPFADFNCKECGGTQMIEDRNTGDLVCQQCGTISMERVISEEAEYRVFSEGNSKNRIHYGSAYYNWLPLRTNTTSRSDRDENEFLWNGFRNIEEVMLKLQHGYGINKPVENRAKFLYYKIYQKQVEEKSGVKVLKRTNKKREKFARRKQFVVACILEALQRENIHRWTVRDISNMFDGADVSESSVKKCLKEMKDLGVC